MATHALGAGRQAHIRLGTGPADWAPVERAALQWALRRGSRSGRTAWQFARDWVGRCGDAP